MKYLFVDLENHKIVNEFSINIYNRKNLAIAINKIFFAYPKNVENNSGTNDFALTFDKYLPFSKEEIFGCFKNKSIIAVLKDDIKKLEKSDNINAVIPLFNILFKHLNIENDGLYFIAWTDYIYCMYIEGNIIKYYLDGNLADSIEFINGCAADIEKIFEYKKQATIYFDNDISSLNKKTKINYLEIKYAFDIKNISANQEFDYIIKCNASKKNIEQNIFKAAIIIIFFATIANLILYLKISKRNIDTQKYNDLISSYNQTVKEFENQQNQWFVKKSELNTNKNFHLFSKKLFWYSNNEKVKISNLRLTNSNDNNAAFNDLKKDLTNSNSSFKTNLSFFIECNSANEKSILAFIDKIKKELNFENIDYEIYNSEKYFICKISGSAGK